jgi:predicted GNAT family acetyltransferase
MSNPIRLLTPADVPQALGLSRSVAWNQTAEDWRLVIEMNPEGCFAIEQEGAVVATTTTIRYGTDLAWIGMVLTHPDFRGRGYARALMERALDHLDGIETVKLDATEMGAPLYKKLGFVDECPIERWTFTPNSSASASVETYAVNPALDQEAFGADRSALLNRLAKIESASLKDAYAMGRGNRFGPCVSRSKESARILAQRYLANHPNQPRVWDLFPENNLAQELGFERNRRLIRMTKGRKIIHNPQQIYAAAGFEFG